MEKCREIYISSRYYQRTIVENLQKSELGIYVWLEWVYWLIEGIQIFLKWNRDFGCIPQVIRNTNGWKILSYKLPRRKYIRIKKEVFLSQWFILESPIGKIHIVKYIKSEWLCKIFVLISCRISAHKRWKSFSWVLYRCTCPTNGIEIFWNVSWRKLKKEIEINIVSKFMNKKLDKLTITQNMRREWYAWSMNASSWFYKRIINKYWECLWEKSTWMIFEYRCDDIFSFFYAGSWFWALHRKIPFSCKSMSK